MNTNVPFSSSNDGNNNTINNNNNNSNTDNDNTNNTDNNYNTYNNISGNGVISVSDAVVTSSVLFSSTNNDTDDTPSNANHKSDDVVVMKSDSDGGDNNALVDMNHDDIVKSNGNLTVIDSNDNKSNVDINCVAMGDDVFDKTVHNTNCDGNDNNIVINANDMLLWTNGLTNLRDTLMQFISTNKTMSFDEDVQMIVSAMKDGHENTKRSIGMIEMKDKRNNVSSSYGSSYDAGSSSSSKCNGDDESCKEFSDCYNLESHHHQYEHHQQHHNQPLQLQSTISDINLLINQLMLRYHNETTCPKINFMEFHAGDIALFMPAGDNYGG